MKLLLDAHLSRDVAQRLIEQGVDVAALRDWRGGAYLDAPDERILSAAATEGRILVSYDVGTLPTLLRAWAAAGIHHRGVILVEERTIRQDDFGSQIRALSAMVGAHGDDEWEDQMVFLEKVPG